MLPQISFIVNSSKGKFSKPFFSSFLTWTQDRQTDNVEHYIKMPLVRNKRFADAINDTPKLHITRFVWNCERNRVVCVCVWCVPVSVCPCMCVCVHFWVSVCQSERGIECLRFHHFNQASRLIDKESDYYSEYFDFGSNQMLESNSCPL